MGAPRRFRNVHAQLLNGRIKMRTGKMRTQGVDLAESDFQRLKDGKRIAPVGCRQSHDAPTHAFMTAAREATPVS